MKKVYSRKSSQCSNLDVNIEQPFVNIKIRGETTNIEAKSDMRH